jgi:hypothetical protein
MSAEIECQRLRQEIFRLEEQKKLDRQQIEELEKDSIAYRRVLQSWAKEQISPEDLQRWAMDDSEEGCLEFHEFIGELESFVKQFEPFPTDAF